MPQNETRVIRRGEGNVIGIITPLFAFNTIYDTDVGLIELVRREYRDPDVFNLDLLDSYTDRRKLIKDLYKRTEQNPLTMFMNNPDEEVASDYYQQFMTQKYDDILKLCVHTGLYNMISMIPAMEEINATIYYTNDIERHYLEKDFKGNLRGISIKELHELNGLFDSFNAYFVRSVFDSEFDFIMHFARSVSIYILDYGYNFDSEGKLLNSKNILEARIAHCILEIINVYNMKLLEGENHNGN